MEARMSEANSSDNQGLHALEAINKAISDLRSLEALVLDGPPPARGVFDVRIRQAGYDDRDQLYTKLLNVYQLAKSSMMQDLVDSSLCVLLMQWSNRLCERLLGEDIYHMEYLLLAKYRKAMMYALDGFDNVVNDIAQRALEASSGSNEWAYSLAIDDAGNTASEEVGMALMLDMVPSRSAEKGQVELEMTPKSLAYQMALLHLEDACYTRVEQLIEEREAAWRRQIAAEQHKQLNADDQ